MKIEEINDWFARKGCKAGQQTHLFTPDGTQWKKMHVDDNDESKVSLSNMVWEASLIKSPVLCKEVLTPTFALHFDIEAKGFQDQKIWGDTMKKVATKIGKKLSGFYPELTKDYGFSANCAIFVTSPEAGQGQVVFPDIIVNAERHRDLRTAVVEELNGDALVHEMGKYSALNMAMNIVKPLSEDQTTPVPLSKVEGTDGDLKPLAFAVITAERVAPKKAPGDGKAAWVYLGLKRRDVPTTDWRAPQRARKGATKDGSSGKSSGKSSSDKSGVSGFGYGGDKIGK